MQYSSCVERLAAGAELVLDSWLGMPYPVHVLFWAWQAVLGTCHPQGDCTAGIALQLDGCNPPVGSY